MERVGFFTFDWIQKTDLLFYPYGSNIPYGFQMDFWVPIILLILNKFFTTAIAWNILTIVSISLTGFSIFLLVRYITRSEVSSFLCGIFFITSPGYLEEVYEGILEQAGLYFLILYILYLLKAFEEKPRINAALVVLFILSSLNSIYHLFFIILFTLIFYLYRERNLLRKKVVILLCLLGITAVSYFSRNEIEKTGVGLLLLHRETIESILMGRSDKIDSLDSKLRFIFGRSLDMENSFLRKKTEPMKSYFFGYLYILGIIALIFDYKGSRFWILTALILFLPALGPYLIISKKILFPLPNILLYVLLPFLTVLKQTRFLKMAQICFIVLAGRSLNLWFSSKNISGGVKNLVFAAALALPFIELLYIPPSLYPGGLLSMKVPRYYEMLSKKKEDAAIIEAPIYPLTPILSGQFFYFQSYHKKKMVNSDFVLLEEKEVLFSLMDSNTFIDFIVRGFSEENSEGRAIKKKDVENLRKMGFKYLILHQKFDKEDKVFKDSLKSQFFSLRFLESLRVIFGEPEIFEDGIMVFSLDKCRETPDDQYFIQPENLFRRFQSRETVTFFASLNEEKVLLDRYEGKIKKISFWYKGIGCKINPPLKIVAAGENGDLGKSPYVLQNGDLGKSPYIRQGEARILGSLVITPEENYWRRGEILIEEGRKEDKVSIFVLRPYGAKECQVEITNVEIMAR